MRNNRNKNFSRDRNSRKSESVSDILPSSEILEKFEDASPGSVAELISMAQQEQKHRHDWQGQYLKSHNLSTRIGQVFGLIYNLALLGVVANLINSGEKELGIKIFTINAVAIAFIALITTFERRVFSRRPRARNGREDSRRSDTRKDNRNKERA